MPIEKTTITKIRQAGGNFVVLPSATITAIKIPESVAILVYLLDRPDDWIIRRADLMARFDLGRDRYDRAMRHLKELGLAWWTEAGRDENGRITGRILHVTASLSTGNIQASPSPEDGLTTLSENRPFGTERSDYPQSGKTDHLHSTELTNTTTKKKSAPRKLPEDWWPSDELLQRVQVLGITLIDPLFTINEFKDYWIANGKRKADWNTTFLNRMKAQFKYEQSQRERTNGKTTSTDILANNLNQAINSDATAGW